MDFFRCYITIVSCKQRCYDQRPSFELKLHRNAWAAGARSLTPLGELTELPKNP